MKIESSVALVTGGAAGLGLAIANHLHVRGARVHVLDKDAAALGLLPAGILGQQADVTQPGEVRAVVASIGESAGGVDILVNNAGWIHSEPLVNLLQAVGGSHDPDRFRRCLETNLFSTFLVGSVVAEQMVRKRKKGVIINISSVSAAGNAGQTAYAAAKAGVNAMTLVWAKELGRMGIRCNAVAPGFIDTESTRKALAPAALEQVRDLCPLRRLGEPSEVAHAVALLVENDFANGGILSLDGGITI